MLQYAKKALVDKIKKEKEVKRKKEQEKHNIAGKLNKITEYDNLKETIKIVKEGIGVIALALVIVMGLFSLCGITVAFIIVYDSAMAVIFLPKKFYKLNKYKKELKNFSQEEVDELRENEESMKELYQRLEKEITNSQRLIDQYEQELGEIAIIEKFKNSNTMNQPFYQADTEEEYNQLLNTQVKTEMTLNEFLNERVNYENIHLEAQEVDFKTKCLIKK